MDPSQEGTCTKTLSLIVVMKDTQKLLEITFCSVRPMVHGKELNQHVVVSIYRKTLKKNAFKTKPISAYTENDYNQVRKYVE